MSSSIITIIPFKNQSVNIILKTSYDMLTENMCMFRDNIVDRSDLYELILMSLHMRLFELDNPSYCTESKVTKLLDDALSESAFEKIVIGDALTLSNHYKVMMGETGGYMTAQSMFQSLLTSITYDDMVNESASDYTSNFKNTFTAYCDIARIVLLKHKVFDAKIAANIFFINDKYSIQYTTCATKTAANDILNISKVVDEFDSIVIRGTYIDIEENVILCDAISNVFDKVSDKNNVFCASHTLDSMTKHIAVNEQLNKLVSYMMLKSL